MASISSSELPVIHHTELDDAWLYHTQIHKLTVLANVFPGIPIVLDHVGGSLGVGPYRAKRCSAPGRRR